MTFFMPKPEAAQPLVEGRKPGDDAETALDLGLELRKGDVRRRLDQPLEVGFIRLEQRAAMAAIACRCRLPVARTRCISLIAADGLTANRRAAWRIELPPATARTILCLRSKDIGGGMTPPQLPQLLLSNHRHRFHAIGTCSRCLDTACPSLAEAVEELG
jgi:hypothetical protein